MDTKLIKQLRDKTGAGIMDAKKALEEFGGDYEKAKRRLMEKGLSKAETKGDRAVNSGLVEAYVHNGRVGAMVKVMCETDFVAKTEEFKALSKEISMQAAAMPAENLEEFLKQPYIRDSKKTVADLVKETIAKVGENIRVEEVVRVEL